MTISAMTVGMALFLRTRDLTLTLADYRRLLVLLLYKVT